MSDTLDDLLREVYQKLIAGSGMVTARRGTSREILGALLEIERPRARLSRTETRGKPFSALGELLWYFSQDNQLDFIKYYIPRYDLESKDRLAVYGGYGPRLFRQRGLNQIENVLALLKRRPTSRRAVIQLFNAEDIADDHIEIPCTTTFQFFIREDKLQMLTTMRSNDAYKGLPHDVFCFTMIQEFVARSLDIEVGSYRHFVGSLHLYEEDVEDAQQFLGEELQPRIEMPPMPIGNPRDAIRRILEAELRIRQGETLDADKWTTDPYWADLVRLLQIFRATGDQQRIDELKSAMNFKKYSPYIDGRKKLNPRDPLLPAQASFRL